VILISITNKLFCLLKGQGIPEPRKDVMTYSRHNTLEERQEACQIATRITEICAAFQIVLDPIDWQQFGLQAPVKVQATEVALLCDLWPRDQDDLFRQIQIKLLEHAALKTLRSRTGLKATIWSPVQVLQPQAFLSLWVITLETNERIPVIEYIHQEQRLYAPFQIESAQQEALTLLFGPAITGEYSLGEMITIKERGTHYTGKIVHILPPGQTPLPKKPTARRYYTTAGKSYTDSEAARYIVDCKDGFPHIVHQSQIVQ
jgi:hypothetical protein